MSELPRYSRAQVFANENWFVLNHHVVELNDRMRNDHPGGDEILRDVALQKEDGTGAFWDIGHSTYAGPMLVEWDAIVGVLNDQEVPSERILWLGMTKTTELLRQYIKQIPVKHRSAVKSLDISDNALHLLPVELLSFTGLVDLDTRDNYLPGGTSTNQHAQGKSVPALMNAFESCHCFETHDGFWTPSNHHTFPAQVQSEIFTCLLIHQRKEGLPGKLPKDLLMMLIPFIASEPRPLAPQDSSALGMLAKTIDFLKFW